MISRAGTRTSSQATNQEDENREEPRACQAHGSTTQLLHEECPEDSDAEAPSVEDDILKVLASKYTLKAGETHDLQLCRAICNTSIIQHSTKIEADDIIPAERVENSHANVKPLSLPRALRPERLHHAQRLAVFSFPVRYVSISLGY